MLENAGEMRIRDDFLDDGVPALGIAVGVAVTKRITRKTRADGFQIALFFMEKSLSIRDETLQVADLWVIDSRIINFSDYAVPQGEPNSARSCIRRPHSIFVAVSPSWLDARSSESAVFVRRSTAEARMLLERPRNGHW